jgi:hypothetical protein
VGKKAENQRKSREKSKVVENQVFWLDFCAKEKDCAYTLWIRGSLPLDYNHDPAPSLFLSGFKDVKKKTHIFLRITYFMYRRDSKSTSVFKDCKF